MSQSRLAPWLLLPCVVLFAVLAVPWHGTRARAPAASENVPAEAQPRPEGGVPAADASAAQAAPAPQPALGAMAYDARLGRYVASAGHTRAVLSVSPRLQQGL